MYDNSNNDQNISVIIRIKGKTSEDLKYKLSSIKVINNNSISIDAKKKRIFL